jgi:hypothetical protein
MAKQADDKVVLPENLSELSDADVADLHSTALDQFDALYGDGQNVSDEDYETLASLRDTIKALASEQSTREGAATERQTKAAALASEVRPLSSDTETDGADEEEDDADENDEDTDPEPDPDAAAQTVTAAGRTKARVPARKALRPKVPAPSGLVMRDVAYATADTLGVGMNEGLDWATAGKMLDKRLTSFNRNAYAAAQARGQHMREQGPIMAFKRQIPAELIASGENVDDVMTRAVDTKRLPGGALTAAGWCAPSEVLYDLCSTASRDGLYSLPEFGVRRGGIRWPITPSFASVYNEVGFHFTEADAIAGFYGNPVSTAIAFPATTAVTVGQVINLTGGQVRVTTAGTTAASAPTLPAAVGGTVASGTATLTRISSASGNVAGSKPCIEIPCPVWDEARLEGDGLCVIGDLIQMRGYPEMMAWYLEQALIAHDHKMSANDIAKVIAGSTAVTMTTGTVGTAAPLLAAVELESEHIRYIGRHSRNLVLEAVFPYWIHGAIRQDLSVRLGMAMFDVTDAMIDAWFRLRGIVPQFVYDWQALDTVAAATFKTWPTTVKFLIYAAGTWTKGVDDIITLDNLYDSTQLGNNKFTALFTEDASLVVKRCEESRVVTVPVMSDGSTAAGVILDGALVGS